jgi:hypothetical protein
MRFPISFFRRPPANGGSRPGQRARARTRPAS